MQGLAGRGVWQYMVNGECMGEYLISEAEDKCAFVGTTNNSDSLHIGVGVKTGRTRYEFVSSVVTTPHTAPVVSVLVAERSGTDLIQISGSGPVTSATIPSTTSGQEKTDDVRWVVSGYPYTLALVTRLYSTLSAVLKNSVHYGDLSGIFEWRDVESGTVPVYYMLLHIPNTSLFASPFLKATEHVVDMVLQVVVNVADGWSEVGVAKFYRSGEGRKKGILRGRVDMIRTSMSEQGHSLKSLRFKPRVLYVDGPEIKDHEERRVWLKTSPVPTPVPLPAPTTTEEGVPAVVVPVKPTELKDPDTKPVVEESQVPQIKALLERLIPSFYTMLKACDTSRARKYLQEMDGEQRKKFLNTPGPDLTEFQTYPPLLLSSRWASPELAKFLVAQGADVTQSLMIEGRATNALHHAIAIADPSNQGWELVKYFVEKCRIEIDVLALDWAHNRVRGGSSKAKTTEQIAYLWSKVPVKRRKDLAAAFAVPIGNRPAPPLVFLPSASAAPFRPEVRIVSPVTATPTSTAASLLVTPLAAGIPSITPKQRVESKSGHDNWRSATAGAPWALAPAAPQPTVAPAPAATAAVRRGNFGGVAPAAPYRQSQLETAAANAVAVPQPPTQSKALPEQTATGSRYVPPALRKQHQHEVAVVVTAPAPASAPVLAPAVSTAVVSVPAKLVKSTLKGKKGPSSHATTTSSSSLEAATAAVPSKKVPKSSKSPLAPSLPHSASLALAQAHQLQLMHDRAKAKAQLTRSNPLALLAHAKAAQAAATALAIKAQKAAQAQAQLLAQPTETVSWGRFGGC